MTALFRRSAISRPVFQRPPTSISYSRISFNKKGRTLSNPPDLVALSRKLKNTSCGTRLPPGRRGARRGCSCCRLRNTQVARGSRLGDLVDHQLQSRARPAGIEEDRLVHRTILLFEAGVIRQDIDRVAVLLGVGGLHFDLNAPHLRPTALPLHTELEVIALAHAAELIDFIVVPRDERAHLAAGHLNAV